MTQYVKISSEEQLFGARSLLEAQASMLTSIQHIENYQKLRAEELKMKILIRRILGETKQSLIDLEKVLPESPVPKEKKEKIVKEEVPAKPKVIKVVKITKDEPEEKTSSIEQELEDIKRRLSNLQ